MNPTNYLRFVKRFVPIHGEPHSPNGSVGVSKMILQQWWNNIKLTENGFQPVEGGEWRDVPTEEA
jgi:hypothetical protein